MTLQTLNNNTYRQTTQGTFSKSLGTCFFDVADVLQAAAQTHPAWHAKSSTKLYEI